MNDAVSLIGIPDDNRARVRTNTGRIADIEVNIPGTTEINHLIDKNVVPFRTVALGGSRTKEVDLGQPSLVLNTICEADANQKALTQAAELIEKLKVDTPVLNHPDNILKTTRNNVYDLLKGIEGIRVPKTNCNVSDENEWLIFEINACMTSSTRKKIDHLEQAKSSIRSAVTRMLIKRLDHV